jgi:hypothetical protein
VGLALVLKQRFNSYNALLQPHFFYIQILSVRTLSNQLITWPPQNSTLGREQRSLGVKVCVFQPPGQRHVARDTTAISLLKIGFIFKSTEDAQLCPGVSDQIKGNQYSSEVLFRNAKLDLGSKCRTWAETISQTSCSRPVLMELVNIFVFSRAPLHCCVQWRPLTKIITFIKSYPDLLPCSYGEANTSYSPHPRMLY